MASHLSLSTLALLRAIEVFYLRKVLREWGEGMPNSCTPYLSSLSACTGQAGWAKQDLAVAKGNQSKWNFPFASLPRTMEWEGAGHAPRKRLDSHLNVSIQDTCLSTYKPWVPHTLPYVQERKNKQNFKSPNCVHWSSCPVRHSTSPLLHEAVLSCCFALNKDSFLLALVSWLFVSTLRWEKNPLRFAGKNSFSH